MRNPEASPWFQTALIVLGIAAILTVWMPMRDEEAHEAERAFYQSCMARDGERVIVEASAGSWQCPERHQVVAYGEARR